MLPTPAQATSGTYNKTFASSTSDGYAYSSSATYNTAWTATTGTVSASATTLNIGQSLYISDYTIHRGFLFFDTSSLPDGATVTAASLCLYVVTDYSVANFNVTVQSGMPTYPNDPLATSDYNKAYYSGCGGSKDTSTITSTGAYWNITMNSTGMAWVSKTGSTKLCLRDYNDTTGVAPTGDQYIIIDTRNAGRYFAPLLVLTYTVTATYLYELRGPYTDAPTEIYNGTLDITVFYDANNSETKLLDGSYNVEDISVIGSSVKPLAITYNISSTGNYSRTIYIANEGQQIYIFTPSADTPTYLYTFNVIDMQGITNGYLESRIYYNGSYRTVERHEIGTLGDVPLYMQWACTYDLQITCDQGTLSLGAFTALGVSSANIAVPYGSFPSSIVGSNATVSVLRMNSTWVQMNYTDSASLTDWVYMVITHTLDGSTVTDYSTNATSIPVQVNWYSAEAITDYNVTVTYLYNGTQYTYTYTCAAPLGLENPWDFISPPYCYGLAVALTIGVGCVFSYATIVGGAWSMVGLAAFFCWIGWLPQTAATYGTIAFGGFISGLISIGEWKKMEREV